MAGTNSGPTRGSAHWSTDYVEHLRTVHFTLVAVCVALIILSTARTQTEAQTAYQQIQQIREFLRDFHLSSWFDTDLRKHFSESKGLQQLGRLSLLPPKGAIITAEDVNIRCPFELYDNLTLRVPEAFESQLFDRDSLETVGVTTVLQKQETLKQFRNMWDVLNQAYAEVPLELSTTAYVCRSSDYQHPIRAALRFEKLDHPPQSPYPFELRTFSPRALELVRSQDSAFDHEIYYRNKFALPSLTHGGKLVEQVQVWIPVEKSTRLSGYDGQAVLISHARQDGYYWRHGSFDSSFRELNEVTKDYQDIDLGAIERIGRSEAQRTGDSLELVGVKVPAGKAVIWGTIVILAIQMYLWIHLRQLSPNKLQPNDPGRDVAWIGVYTSLDAKFAMLSTTVVLPTVVLLGLQTRWFKLPLSEFNWPLLAFTVPLSILLGVWSQLIRPSP